MSNFRPTFAEVDLSALRHNVKWLRARAGSGTWFCPMVKANAYGHGAVSVAKVLAELKVDAIGVAMVEEGLVLRQAGIKIPILVFGIFSQEAAALAVKENLTPVLSRWQDLEFFKIGTPSQYPVHLKFNTGMNRLGFEVNDAAKVAEFLKLSSKLKVTGICSHLSQGEDWSENSGASALQAEKLKVAASGFLPGPVVHLLNSAALLSPTGTRGLGVRPGISMYGAGLTMTSAQGAEGLRPVMHLRSEVALLHHLKAKEGVSYNSTWRAKKASTVAVIPIGYADGIPRLGSNRLSALVRGQRVPLVGTVCMDYIILDVTKLQKEARGVLPGEPVTLWGEQGEAVISADEVAGHAETIAYELFTGVGARVPRRDQDGV